LPSEEVEQLSSEDLRRLHVDPEGEAARLKINLKPIKKQSK